MPIHVDFLNPTVCENIKCSAKAALNDLFSMGSVAGGCFAHEQWFTVNYVGGDETFNGTAGAIYNTGSFFIYIF